MGRKRNDQVKDSFITLKSAADILRISEKEIRALVEKHQITGYQLGDQGMRFKQDQVWELQSKIRISGDLFPNTARQAKQPLVAIKSTFKEKTLDFFYFNDFYIVTFALISALLYLILSSQ